MASNRIKEIYEAAAEAARPMLPVLARMGADAAEQVIEGLASDGDLMERALIILRQNAGAEEWKQIAAALADASNQAALKAALNAENLRAFGRQLLFAAGSVAVALL